MWGDKEPRPIYPDLSRTGWMAIAVVWAFTVLYAFGYGRQAESNLTLSAIDNTDYAVTMLGQCLDDAEAILGLVKAQDSSLYEQVEALPLEFLADR